jgi:hypothetical protein
MDTKGRRHIPKALEHEQSNQDCNPCSRTHHLNRTGFVGDFLFKLGHLT